MTGLLLGFFAGGGLCGVSQSDLSRTQWQKPPGTELKTATHTQFVEVLDKGFAAMLVAGSLPDPETCLRKRKILAEELTRCVLKWRVSRQQR